MKFVWNSLLLFTMLASLNLVAAGEASPLPYGKRCAVTFSIDDGFWNSSKQMADILDRYQLKATFNIVTHWVEPMKVSKISDDYNIGVSHGTWPKWKSILERGHEIGSHTSTHPALPTIKPEDAKREIISSKQMLIDELGVKEPITFGYPYNQQSPEIKEIVSEHYLSARIGGKVFNDLASVDLQSVNSWWPYSDTPLEDIIAKIDEAKANGYWLVIGLHGMNDEGWHPITPEKFEAVCKYLASDNEIWVATFKEMSIRLVNRKSR